MDFADSQYVVYRHSDKDHDHVHIVASRIRITDGTTVNDSWDYVRSEKLLRELEKKYQLTPTISSKQKHQRGHTSGEIRLIERTGTESVRTKLQQAIDEQTIEPITMPELVNRLQEQGIDARISWTRTGLIRGISFQLDGVAFSGTHLGSAYTFPGLQKHKQVSFNSEQHREELALASKREPISEIIDEKLLEPRRKLAQKPSSISAEFVYNKFLNYFRSVDELSEITHKEKYQVSSKTFGEINVKESSEELAEKLRQAKTSREKEKLQVLYWLKQEKAPKINAISLREVAEPIANSLGKHRGTVQNWLSIYRKKGIDSMLETKSYPGGVRIIPQWAEKALETRLQEQNHGFASYGAVQQWLSETLGIEAEYHAVYQMTRYRLKAKLKVARPENSKQKQQQRAAFKKTLVTTSNY